MKTIFLSAILFCSGATLHAQDKYFTKSGKVSFNASAKIEKIEATNRTAIAVIDTKSGEFQMSVMLKGFEFEKALMQEHFNENYVESDKYPKCQFSGQIVNNGSIYYTKNGVYDAKVKGKLLLHGKEKEVEAAGKITVQNGKIIMSSDFMIQLSDFNISIPSLVKENISNETKISVNCAMDPLKN